jgi:hypothetical protein
MEQSNIPGMLRRILKMARTVGTAEDKRLAPLYEAELNRVVEQVEPRGEVLAVNFAQAKPEGTQ